MFHALPPSLEGGVRHRLAEAAEQPPPRAEIAGLMDLGGGVAFRVVSEDLDEIRADLVDAFRGSLTAQDGQGWRPHVTIQNKVPTKVARALLEELRPTFAPRCRRFMSLMRRTGMVCCMSLRGIISGP